MIIVVAVIIIAKTYMVHTTSILPDIALLFKELEEDCF